MLAGERQPGRQEQLPPSSGPTPGATHRECGEGADDDDGVDGGDDGDGEDDGDGDHLE